MPEELQNIVKRTSLIKKNLKRYNSLIFLTNRKNKTKQMEKVKLILKMEKIKLKVEIRSR